MLCPHEKINPDQQKNISWIQPATKMRPAYENLIEVRKSLHPVAVDLRGFSMESHKRSSLLGVVAVVQFSFSQSSSSSSSSMSPS